MGVDLSFMILNAIIVIQGYFTHYIVTNSIVQTKPDLTTTFNFEGNGAETCESGDSFVIIVKEKSVGNCYCT